MTRRPKPALAASCLRPSSVPKSHSVSLPCGTTEGAAISLGQAQSPSDHPRLQERSYRKGKTSRGGTTARLEPCSAATNRDRTFLVLGRLVQEAEKTTSHKIRLSNSLKTHLQAVLSPSFPVVQGGNSAAGRARCVSAKPSPEQPGTGKSGCPHRPAMPFRLHPLSSGFMRRCATVPVTSIKAGIATLEGRQHPSAARW